MKTVSVNIPDNVKLPQSAVQHKTEATNVIFFVLRQFVFSLPLQLVTYGHTYADI